MKELEQKDEILVKNALSGSKSALTEIVNRYQQIIYNIALRMLFEPEDAKDAAQEVLIKVITKLDSFRNESKFKTWVYRITVNHILNIKKSAGERMHTSGFEEYSAVINKTPDGEISSGYMSIDSKIIIEEVRISCMYGMLLCLNREQRIVYILGSIFNLTDAEASEILDISNDSFRKKLSRARSDLHSFMENQCGLVNPVNPCRCSKKTKSLIESGYVNPSSLKFNRDIKYRIKESALARINAMDEMIDRKYTEQFSTHPYHPAPDFLKIVNELLTDKKFKNIFNLN